MSGVDMDERPDGRKYARPTRRCKIGLEVMDEDVWMSVDEMIDEMVRIAPQEFFLTRYGRPVSPSRLRAYVRYLQHLGVVAIEERRVLRQLDALPTSDQNWAQVLADKARASLSRSLDTSPATLPERVGSQAQRMLDEGSPPTIPEIVHRLGVHEGQDKEYARWDLYLMCDAPASPFAVRRHPTLWVTRGRRA